MTEQVKESQKPNWQGRTGLSAGCTLAGEVALAILMEGREHPCDGCNADRDKCHGFPNRDQAPPPPTPARAQKRFQIRTHYRQRVVRPIPTAREFQPPRWLRWIGRPLHWFWEVCSRQYFEVTSPIKSVLGDEEMIRKVVRKSKHNIENIWDQHCRHIVVGPEIFRELTDELMESPLSFSTTIELQLAAGLHDIRVFDMQVHVIPWFTGCLLLPDWPERTERTEA